MGVIAPSLAHVILKHLSDHYGVEFEPGGRRTQPKREGAILNFRMPDHLYGVVAQDALDNRISVSEQIRRVLADHYSLTPA